MIPPPKFTPSQRVPFQEAIEWQAEQAPWISGSSWATMAGLAALKGDQVSGAVLLSVLDDVWGEIDRSVQDGLPYGEFLRNTAERMKTQWWSVDSPRMKLIYHNNMGNALMAGRQARMDDPDIRAARPFVLFDATIDFRTSLVCSECDGTILPIDDPWWDTHSPLLHHGCRSGKITLDEDDVAELGGVTGIKSTLPVPEGWGAPYSWQSWKPKPENYHAPLYQEWEKWTTGQDYIHTKEDWDIQWQTYAARLSFQKRAAEAKAANEAKLKGDELELNDPTKNVAWGKSPKYDGLKLNGIAINPPIEEYWTTVKDVATGEPELPTGMGKVATGIIVVEDDGRIWVVEPANHYGGYEHTFPKGQLEKGLTAQQNALKELYEEAGITAEINGYVGDFKSDSSVSRYYIAKRTGGQPWLAHWESENVKLITVESAQTMLNTTRDKEILAVLTAKLAGAPVPQGLKTYVAPKKPVEAPKQPTAAPVEPISTDPFGLDPSKFVWYADKPGGSSPGAIVAHPDAPGKTFLIKQLTDEFKAEAEITGCALYGLVNDDIVSVKMADSSKLPPDLKGRFVTIQQMEPGTVGLTSLIGSKSYPDFTKMTVGQQAELLAHGVASWIAGEHDGHAEQYLLKGDKLLRIDLGQSLKYTLTTGDKLDLNYHPNAAYGEARPLHLQLLKAIQDGKIDPWVLKHSKILDAVNKAGTITEAQIEKAVGKYGDLARGGKTKADIVKLLKDRAQNAKDDWADLFTKVQGKKFTWEDGVKVKEQPKPKEPKQGRKKPSDMAPKIAQGVSLPKSDKELSTFGAVTMAADGDKLRAQAWRVQKATLEGSGAPYETYVFTGEIDQSVWSDVSSALRKNGATVGQWVTYPRVGMFQGKADTASSPIKKFNTPKASGFLGSGLVVKGDGYKIYFGDGSAHTAQKGQIKIEVGSPDPKEAQKIFAKALRVAGLEKYGMDRKPTPEESKIAKINRALWNIEGGSYKPIMSVDEGVKRLESHGVNEGDLMVVQNSLGYNEPRIDGRWKKYRKDGVRYLYHQFRPDESPTRGISGADGGKGGIFSTVARSENGIVISGMSSSTDLTTGGASSVFTRVVGNKSSDSGSSWYGTSNSIAVLSPKILDRTDFYGYTYDNYGRSTGSSFEGRDGSDDLLKELAQHGASSNEIMFRNVVAREDILFFAVASDYLRSSLLATLQGAGVKTIRGQPVDEMVVVMKTPSDMSRLNSKNPVHAFLLGKRETYPEWTEVYGNE